MAERFTTQSVTAVLEKIRDQIQLGTPAAADFALGPGGTRAVYPLNALTDIVFVRQTGTAPGPTSFSPTATAFRALSLFVSGTVGTVAFGKYVSPDYLTADRYIPVAGSRLGTPGIQGTNDVFFNLILPVGSLRRSGGRWPSTVTARQTTSRAGSSW